jgi:hypothetical protein
VNYNPSETMQRVIKLPPLDSLRSAPSPPRTCQVPASQTSRLAPCENDL